MKTRLRILGWCIGVLLVIATSTMGLIIMTGTDTSRKPVFRLNPVREYFDDEKTVSLVSAAMTGDIVKARWLVAEGANPNDEGPRSNPYNRLRPLNYVIAANNLTAVKILMDVGADPELDVAGFGSAFIFTAIVLRNADMLSFLLDLRPVNTLSKDTIEDLLFESVSFNCRPCLELLLKRGAPIDTLDDAGYSIMMDAMDCQDYDLAEWLLLKGASVHIEAGSGVTPAYSVEFHLRKFQPGSPTYKKVQHIKELMQARGVVFPAQTPEQVRAKWAEKH